MYQELITDQKTAYCHLLIHFAARDGEINSLESKPLVSKLHELGYNQEVILENLEKYYSY